MSLFYCLLLLFTSFTAASNETCTGQRLPFFLKMYKIGGETVIRSMTMSFGTVFLKSYSSRNVLSHDMSSDFGHRGMDGLRQRLTPPADPNCITLLTVIRNPIERLLSQIFFYRTYENMINKAISHSSGNQTESLRCFDKFQRDTSAVTPDEMSTMLRVLTESRPADTKPLMYLRTLSASFGQPWDYTFGMEPPPGTLEKALHALHNDLALVGYTESISSFYVLFSRMFGVPLNTTCSADLKHGMAKVYKGMFKTADRPPAKSVISAETYAYLEKYLHSEFIIWNAAKNMHHRDLEIAGLTVESASKLWSEACPSLTYYPKHMPLPLSAKTSRKRR